MGSFHNQEADDKPAPEYGNVVLSLKTMLLPQETLLNPPSVADGLDIETEYELRVSGCELIQTAGMLLKLPQVAMSTGQVLFHRFYYRKSFLRHPVEISAMACIFLASKTENAPRRVRDILNVFYHMRQIRCQNPIKPLLLDEHYVALKTEVIKFERWVLKELGFCVHVEHPYKLIICYLQVLTLETNQRVLQMSWNYMNDSYRTDVSLRYSPDTLTCACIYLSCRKLKVALPKKPAPWFTLFGVKETDIRDICRRILKLYKRPEPKVQGHCCLPHKLNSKLPPS